MSEVVIQNLIFGYSRQRLFDNLSLRLLLAGVRLRAAQL